MKDDPTVNSDPASRPGHERRSRRDDIRARRRKRRNRSIIAVIASLAVLAVAAWFVTPIVKDLFNRTTASTVTDYEPGGTGEDVTVVIPSGATGAKMAAILKDADVIHTPATFVSAFAANERSSRIQPGTYKLRTKMSAAEAVNALLDPVNRADAALTVPEGFRADQVYERVAKQLDIPLEEVQAAAKDSAAIGLPEEAAGNPEGWFAAQTYSFAPNTSATEVLKEMIAGTRAMLERQKVPAERWQEVLTKASIVEREVPPNYYGEVARVIENRLADVSGPTVGLLQMDSTVLYGLGKRGGIPSAEEVRKDTPYNTYIHKGLPPTPIGSPSEAAIKAVLNPPEGNWLYFVTVDLNTGETLFTGDHEEHKRNIQKLRDWRDANSGEPSAEPTSDEAQ